MTEHLTERVTCPHCNGTGDHPEQPWRQCGWCMGLGALYVNKPSVAAYREPPDEPPGREIEARPAGHA